MKLLDSLKFVILEQDSDLEKEYGKAIVKSTPFNIGAAASCEAMKSSLKNNDIPFAQVGKNGKIKLPGVDDSKYFKSDTQQRFIEWYNNVIQNPDNKQVRGKVFEGLIGGVFGGTVTGYESQSGVLRQDKTDVDVNGVKISVKFREEGNFDKKLPMGAIQEELERKIRQINDSSLQYSQQEINDINRIFERRGYDLLRLPLSKGKKGKPKVKELFENGKLELKNNLGLRKLFESVLDSAFSHIQYIMGGYEGKLNEIIVKQFQTKQLLQHMLNGNFTIDNKTVNVSNLSDINTKVLKIEFPQYTKTQRIKYSIDTKNKKNYQIGDTPTNGGYIRKNGEVVGFVRRSSGDTLTYYVEAYKENLPQDLKNEAINKVIMSDINDIGKLQFSGDVDELLKAMQRLSELYSKKLFISKSKIGSEKSKDFGLSKLIGGNRQDTLSPSVLQNIRKNPDRFLKRFLDLYKDEPERVSKFIEIIRNTLG